MNRGNLRIENVDAFKKERTLFRKENREALVRSNYQLVGFDLRKIRIEGEIQRDVWRDCVFAGQARIKLDRIVDHTTGIECAGGNLRWDQSGPAFSGLRQSYARD